MNKREQAEMINLVVPLDNLFFLAERIEDYILENVDLKADILKNNINEYKKKLLENLNAIEETKDILQGIVHLKVANERIKTMLEKGNKRK